MAENKKEEIVAKEEPKTERKFILRKRVIRRG